MYRNDRPLMTADVCPKRAGARLTGMEPRAVLTWNSGEDDETTTCWLAEIGEEGALVVASEPPRQRDDCELLLRGVLAQLESVQARVEGVARLSERRYFIRLAFPTPCPGSLRRAAAQVLGAQQCSLN